MSTVDQPEAPPQPVADNVPEPFALDADRALLAVVHDDDRTLTTESLERYLAAPLRARGGATLNRPDDFADYVNRLYDPEHTTVWANLDSHRLVAVINDHGAADLPGWRDHKIGLTLSPDPDWQAWAYQANSRMTHTAFAEFLDTYSHTIVNPDAAEVLDTVKSLHGTKTATFRSTYEAEGSGVAIEYENATRAGKSGELDVPTTLSIRVAPWADVPASDLAVRVSYRVDCEQLYVTYRIPKLAHVQRDTFAGLVTELTEKLSPSIYVGAAPSMLDAYL